MNARRPPALPGHLCWLGAALCLTLWSAGCARSQPLCGPSNCTGCCDGQSQCLPGTSVAACGQIGLTCRACGPAEFCSPSGCVPRGASDAGVCGAHNCSGCCLANGQCVATGNLSAASCGRGGERCVACAQAAGQTCDVTTGRCGGCTGCRQTSGACNPLALSATDRRACGVGGGACVDCGVAGTCNSGRCVGGCDGCVTGNRCIPAVSSGSSPTACGLGGVACVACVTGQRCANGRCESADGGCSGCVLANGSCVAPSVSVSSNSTCGVGGAACRACLPGQACRGGSCLGMTGDAGVCFGCLSGAVCVPPAVSASSPSACGVGVDVLCASCGPSQVCSNGLCVTTAVDAGPAPGGAVGDPCVDVRECFSTPTGVGSSGLSQQRQCKTTALGSTLTYPAGLCTRRCLDDVDCGDGGLCAYALGQFGERENVCLRECRDTRDCRVGYTCLFMPTGASACFPASASRRDAGPPAALPAGSACTRDGQCGAAGTFRCQAEVSDAGQPTGWVGGACTGDCAVGLDLFGFCGNGAECIPFTTTPSGLLGPLVDWQCRATCDVPPAPGGQLCRTGYVCDELSPGAGFGVCEPRCTNAGFRCPVGACNASTGLCQ